MLVFVLTKVRCGEAERWAARGFDKLQDGERLLLWHGSRATNFAGIILVKLFMPLT